MALGKGSSRPGYLASVALALTLTACAGTSQPPDELAGHYDLTGVMEMGSQLLLDKKGSFEAVLYYGNLDIYAKGHWSMVNGQVELTVRPEPAVAKEVLLLSTTADRAETKNDGHYRLGSFSTDAYGSPVEVRWVFDDSSEQTMVWNEPLQELMLPRREGKELEKLGVRIAGTETHFEWLAAKAGERDFLMTRVFEKGEPRSFFHHMALTPRGNCLLVNMGINTECYRKR